MRWQYRDPALVWLFVGAFALHIVEEWFGGFLEWFTFVAGRPLSANAFMAINGAGLALMTLAARAATGRESRGWLAIGIATAVLVNGAAHLLASLATGRYAPGLVTGVVLYIPLAQLLLLRAWHQAPEPIFWRGVLAGIVAHALVTFTAVAVA
jgi:hypothetical protein